MLAAREFASGPSRMIVDFLSEFAFDAFGVPRKAGARRWPELEDIFTCVDLSANSGHHLGGTFSPAGLRTVRRALLSRMIRMLNQRYRSGRKRKDSEWRALDRFFDHIASIRVGFISMNWDTVIERKLSLSRNRLLVDYCCDAVEANIPDPLDEDDFKSLKEYQKALQKGQVLNVGTRSADVEERIPVVKMHGSTNWLYCDNCRQVFWVHPDQSDRIATQLIRSDDVTRIADFLQQRGKEASETIAKLRLRSQLYCTCSAGVALSTRIATFSYEKALEFPMFQKSWLAAQALLRSAQRWVFVGYSLPTADYEFKYLLKHTQLSRKAQPEIIVVSGGSASSVSYTHNNYRKLFGSGVSKYFRSGLDDVAIKAITRPLSP